MRDEAATPRGTLAVLAILVAATGIGWSGCGDDDDSSEAPVEAVGTPSEGTGEPQAKAKDERPGDRSDRRDERKDGKRREAGIGGLPLDEGRVQALRELAQQGQGGGSPEEIRDRIEMAKERIKRLGGQRVLNRLRKWQRERQEQQRKEEGEEAEDREGEGPDGE
jgi:hypothetical protein